MNGKGFRALAMLAAAVMLTVSAAVAQSSEGLRIGLLGGVNYNYVDAPLQNYVIIPGNAGFGSHDFSQASAFLGFGGISGEYLFNDFIGATLRTTLDFRCVEQENGGSTFTPHLVYVNIEPGVRVNLGMPQLHALVGGTVAVKALSEYDYATNAPESGGNINDATLNNVRDVAFGAWMGIGYDISLAPRSRIIGWMVTPFVEGSYLFDQKTPDAPLPDANSWNTLTVRAGVQLKAVF